MHPVLTCVLDGGEWSAHTLATYTPSETDLHLHNYQNVYCG
jgi:hypothetical protein